MSLRVLLLEDEPKVARLIHQGLTASGFTVTITDQIVDFEAMLQTAEFDVLIMDRIVNKEDSLHSLPTIRRSYPKSKILILSALSETNDKIRGLDEGANDYLAKPFHVAELIARVRALGRQAIETQLQPQSMTLEYGDLKLNIESQEVYRSGLKIELTAREFKILSLLISRPKKLFSRSELLDRIWGLQFDPESNVVEVAMARLRAKLEMKDHPSLIQSKRGGGYWLGNNPDEN